MLLLAGGFGRTSAQLVDDAGALDAVRLAAEALGVTHMGLAIFGAVLAAGSASGENPVLWAIKLGFTGVGGFAELKRTLDAPQA